MITFPAKIKCDHGFDSGLGNDSDCNEIADILLTGDLNPAYPDTVLRVIEYPIGWFISYRQYAYEKHLCPKHNTNNKKTKKKKESIYSGSGSNTTSDVNAAKSDSEGRLSKHPNPKTWAESFQHLSESERQEIHEAQISTSNDGK